MLWIKLYAYWQGMTFIWALYGGYISVTVGCISSWNIDIFFEFMDYCLCVSLFHCVKLLRVRKLLCLVEVNSIPC